MFAAFVDVKEESLCRLSVVAGTKFSRDDGEHIRQLHNQPVFLLAEPIIGRFQCGYFCAQIISSFLISSNLILRQPLMFQYIAPSAIPDIFHGGIIVAPQQPKGHQQKLPVILIVDRVMYGFYQQSLYLLRGSKAIVA